MTIDFSSPNSTVHRILKGVGLIGFVWMLTALVSLALAQPAGSDLLAPYLDPSRRPVEDMATRVMEGLLGPTYTSPMTAGLTTNTIFGSIFMVFNVIVFAVGTVWASYGVIAGIVQTAHEGVVLGKRMSAVWMPVRMVTGIGGLVPAFGGFSLSQVAMIVATSWGISFANFAYTEALNVANTSATLISPGFSRTNPNKDGPALAKALFTQRTCELANEKAVNDHLRMGIEYPAADLVKEGSFSEFSRTLGFKSGTVLGRAMGTDSDKSSCLAIGIKRKTYFGVVDQGGRWGGGMGGGWLGFRSDAVDYKAINEQTWNGYAENFPELVKRVRDIAADFDRRVIASEGDGTKPPIPWDEVRAAGVWYQGAVQGNNFVVPHQKIKKDALENMAKYGFFAAGSYYSTQAEVNAAVIQASDATEFIIVPPASKSDKQSSGYWDRIYNDVKDSLTFTDPKERDDMGANFCKDAISTSEKCSLGQALASQMIALGTAGSGGSATMVDPIIALKNIGDYMMTLGETILIAPVALKAGAAVAGAAIVVGSGGALAPVVVAAAGMVGALTEALGPMLPYIGGLLFAVGALCAIYIPMVPFINWVSALVQYCCIVVESFAAAPLWALAHLQADGEGMGQRTEKGYLYLLNLLFRPILMVIAFFAASALVIMLGSVVMQMYMPTLVAAQGNSVTGIFSAIGYVFLFFVIMNIIIQGLFHLVMELSDDAIGWVGGIGRNNIGKDVEGKVSTMFVAGGRFGATGIATSMGKKSGDAGVTPPSTGTGKGKSTGGAGGAGGGKKV